MYEQKVGALFLSIEGGSLEMNHYHVISGPVPSLILYGVGLLLLHRTL